MTYRITEGTKAGAIEIYFDSKPERVTLETLKANKFRWNGKKSCWYGFNNAETIGALLGGEVQTAPEESEQTAKATPIKFYYNGIRLNGERELVKCGYSCKEPGEPITIYCHAYSRDLPRDIFEVRNETDIYTDYFDNDSATITAEHPLYKFALYACASFESRNIKKHIEYLEKRVIESPRYADSYREEIERYKKQLKAWESVPDAGQPKNSDLLRVDAENIRKENEKKQAEHEAELKRREEYLCKRVNGREIIRAEAEANPVEEGGATCLIQWSEHPAFMAYKEFLAYESGELAVFKNTDDPRPFHLEGDENLLFSLKAADNIIKKLDANYSELGYDKTSFRITIPAEDEGEPLTYSGRYDIGDHENGFANHIRSLAEYDIKSNPENNSGAERLQFADMVEKLTA